MSRMQINYLDRKGEIIGFYTLCGQYEPRRVKAWTRLLEDASLEAAPGSYPGAPSGWVKFEVVAYEPFRRTYVICNKCYGVATAGYSVDDYFAIDCPACGRHLQNTIETESPGEPAPGSEAGTSGKDLVD
jgi:hypothetical protein